MARVALMGAWLYGATSIAVDGLRTASWHWPFVLGTGIWILAWAASASAGGDRAVAWMAARVPRWRRAFPPSLPGLYGRMAPVFAHRRSYTGR